MTCDLENGSNLVWICEARCWFFKIKHNRCLNYSDFSRSSITCFNHPDFSRSSATDVLIRLIFQEQAWLMFQSCWSCFAGFCKLSQLQFPPTLRILKPVSKRREALVVLTWMQGQAGTQHRSRTQHQGHRCSAGPPAEEFESPHDHPTKSLRMVKRSGLDCLVNLGEMGWNCLVADQTPCNPHPTKKKKSQRKMQI